jgi:dihydrofolate reductase
MGKIVSLVHTSLDGYMANSNREMNWVIFDSTLNDYVTGIRQTAAGTIFGRKTFQMMESYWPKVLENAKDPNDESDASVSYAKWVTDHVKVVVSTTLKETTWANTKFVSDNIKAELSRLKNELDGDLLLIGSPNLHKTLMELDLIDEYRITVNPIALGSGIPLFSDINRVTKLQLLDVKKFDNGVVGLHYQKK